MHGANTLSQLALLPKLTAAGVITPILNPEISSIAYVLGRTEASRKVAPHI
jgi:hypothetical protein